MQPNPVEVIVDIEQVEWVSKNPRYPKEPRYIHQLETQDGQSHIILSNKKISKRGKRFQISGRLIWPSEYIVIEMSEQEEKDECIRW